MPQVINISTENKESFDVKVGQKTLKYQDSLNLSAEAKNIVCNEACDILSHCVPVNKMGRVTNLAIGYVQSGKTMSFTMLTALAADNGYRIVIYLTGTKINLQNQTSKRLKKDLGLNTSHLDYVLINNLDDVSRVKMFLQKSKHTLLIPIMKHHKHINDLVCLLEDTDIQVFLNNQGILIIDDEADQASLNTFSFKNSKKEDWEELEVSKTYDSIIKLKKNLPNHSYIQYTATPQSLLMIDDNDVLSPKYHTVLTPGVGYTGGKYFFVDNFRNHIRIIPEEEIETKKNVLDEIPLSLLSSLKFFLLSVVYKVIIQNEESYLSMMVHIDGTQDSNRKYFDWINFVLEEYNSIIDDVVSRDYLYNEFEDVYNDLLKTSKNVPSLSELLDYLSEALMYFQVHLLQSNADNDVDWDDVMTKGHILVGANMLNRGFTVEKLSTTFMPRTNSTIATADTIEQRCRFFGYKMKYIDVCRIYVSQKACDEFTDYVEHEEILRNALKHSKNLKEYKEQIGTLIISQALKPTRKNILSSDKYVRDNLFGWKQFRTTDFLDENLNVLEDFVNQYKNDFILDRHFNSPARNHRYIDLPVDKAIFWLSKFSYYDIFLRDRRSSTIQYLRYIEENQKDYKVRFYHMAYEMIRDRKLEDDSKPINLQMGHSRDGIYPGDAYFKSDDILTVQLYHIRLEDTQLRMRYNGKQTCAMAIHYPEGVSFSYIQY